MFDKHQYNKEYHRLNRPRMLERNRAWRKNNPDKMMVSRRQSSLKHNYGISLEDYNRLFGEQNGLCLGCYKHQTQLKKRLVVDHNHKTGKVRGLLCSACNTVLGFANDKVETLQRLIDYISRT